MYERFFYRATWSLQDVSRLLLVRVVSPLVKAHGAEAVIDLAIDDTTCGRCGKHAAYAGYFKNASVMPETLLESELFGYKKDAFTDAKRDKPGKFQLAQRGSIFLDDVESVTRAVQVKLLRVIQEKEFEPLGGTKSVKADVRIITASNQPLRDLVGQGRFRDDLFYRLNVVTLELPPLRERRDDIPLLTERFVSQFNAIKGREIAGISPAAMRLLTEYDFPGNVRELQNVIEHAFVLCEGGMIDLQHLARSVIGGSACVEADHIEAERKDQVSQKPLALAEADVIRAALTHNNGRRARTASELGISPTTSWFW